MRNANEVIYQYDGSFEGFLSCIFEIYASKKPPMGFVNSAQGSLLPSIRVETDLQKAERVYTALAAKVSHFAQKTVCYAFMSCHPQKEMALYRFIALGFKRGGAVVSAWAEEAVVTVRRAARQAEHEAERLCGFVRLCDSNGVLTGIIEPDNHILPIMAEHFVQRYMEQPFLIYDKRHRQALIYKPYTHAIVPMEEFTPPAPDARELAFQYMWKRYFDTLPVEGRTNLRQQSKCMPKKYWKHITEMQPESAFDSSPKSVAPDRIL